MKKLTKEQAGWLIEKAIRAKIRINDYQRMHLELPDDIASLDSIIHSIRECTEKKFPYLNMVVSDQGSIELNGSVHRGGHISICTSFKNVKDAMACIDLNDHEFRLFTEGCQKICEWLEEKE